jgi:hypothetical protein
LKSIEELAGTGRSPCASSPAAHAQGIQAAALDGCCVALVYRRLAAGEYAALKDGRSTRIPGSSILERRAAKLKPSAFKKAAEEPNRKAPEASTA